MLFLIISIVIFLLVAIFVPKKLTKSELYAIALFSILLGFFTDITLDIKYNVYGYFEPGVQFSGFLPILFLFPTSGVIFMNFYPYKKPLFYRLFYIICWTIFSLFFEFLSVQSGYFYHNGWTYWHSAITYPFLLWVHLLHFRFFMKFTNN